MSAYGRDATGSGREVPPSDRAHLPYGTSVRYRPVLAMTCA